MAKAIPMIESHDEAVARLCTHRCAHYPTALISEATCEKRKNLLRRNPVVLGPSVYWTCMTCPGAVSIGAEIPIQKPTLPAFAGHESRVLRPSKARIKVCKCKTCGSEDPAKFDLGHSRKCRDCLREYEKAKNLKRCELDKAMRSGKRLVCCRCGKNINQNALGNPRRFDLRLCGACFREFNYAKLRRDKDARSRW